MGDRIFYLKIIRLHFKNKPIAFDSGENLEAIFQKLLYRKNIGRSFFSKKHENAPFGVKINYYQKISTGNIKNKY